MADTGFGNDSNLNSRWSTLFKKELNPYILLINNAKTVSNSFKEHPYIHMFHIYVIKW